MSIKSKIAALAASPFLFAGAAFAGPYVNVEAVSSYTGDDYVHTDRKFEAISKQHIPVQLIMLSNRTPMFIERFDRRFFVAEWTLDIEGDNGRLEYFKRYRHWLEEEGGYGGIAALLEERQITFDPFSSPPFTREKQEAVLAQEDPVVLALQDYLSDSEDRRLFESNHFQSIWSEYNVKSSERKHKLGDAGLKCHGRTKLGNKQPSVWYRDCDKIIAARGQIGLKVKLKDGSLVNALDAYKEKDDF